MKNTFTFILAIALLMSLVGCGSSEATSAAKDETLKETEDTAEETTEETTGNSLETDIEVVETAGSSSNLFLNADIQSGKYGNYMDMDYDIGNHMILHPYMITTVLGYDHKPDIVVSCSLTNESDKPAEVKVQGQFQCQHDGVTAYANAVDYDGMLIDPGKRIAIDMTFDFPDISMETILGSVLACPDGTQINLGPIPQSENDYFSLKGTYVQRDSYDNTILQIQYYYPDINGNYQSIRFSPGEPDAKIIEYMLLDNNILALDDNEGYEKLTFEGGIPHIQNMQDYNDSEGGFTIEEVLDNSPRKVNKPIGFDREQVYNDKYAQKYEAERAELEKARKESANNTYNNNEYNYDLENGYLYPQSDNDYINGKELREEPKEKLRLGRNEIYARHGYIFKSDDLRKYFESQDWYVPSVPADQFDESVLNEYEKANLEVFLLMEDY